MSSSQQTTNLGLPIYGDSDVPNWKDTNTPFQALDDIIGQGGGGGSEIQLDFTNVLHDFSTQSGLSWTATRDCYITGTLGYSAQGKITIDNVIIDVVNFAGSHFITPIRVSKGSVITVNTTQTNVYALGYKVVSSEVTIFNEAEVTLDYGNPLFTFDATHLTYTATKTCWLCGNIDTNTGVNHMSINGHSVAFGNNATQWFSYIPPLKLSKDDVVTFTSNPVMMSVYEGTVSGSVGGLNDNIITPSLKTSDILWEAPLSTTINHTVTTSEEGFLNAWNNTQSGTIFVNGKAICGANSGCHGNEIYVTEGDIITTDVSIAYCRIYKAKKINI